MHKISKIVLFVPTPFNERDFKRFGVDILGRNGFEVFVYDFSPLVYPRMYEAGVLDPIKYEKHFLFVNKCDAIKAIRELKTDAFIILYISYNKKNFWIYKTFSKANIHYMIFLSGSLPERKLEDTDTNHSLKNFFKKVSRLSIKKIINIPYRISFAPYLGIRAVDLVVAAGSESLKIYRNTILFGNKTEVLYTPSLDYNKFLERECPNFGNEANAVYIDPGILNIRGHNHALEESLGKGALSKFETIAAQNMKDMNNLATILYKNFLDI